MGVTSPFGGFGPWLGKLLSNSDYIESRKIKNPLERDVFIKQAVGFEESTFTRLAELFD